MTAVLQAPKFAEVVWLDAPGVLRIAAAELSDLGPYQILCRTIVTAISPGTEIAAFDGKPPLRPGVTYPRLQGYCNVAEVIASGRAVEDFKVGDRVLTFMSHRSAFVLNAREVLYKLPSDADPNDIVCSYLFHLGYNAVIRSNMKQGMKVLVIGLGVLGLASVAMAVRSGARVYCVSNHRKPANIAYAYGAQAVFTRAELDALLENESHSGADIVISTTNTWADWQIALKFANQLGTIAVLGFPGRGEEPWMENPLASEFFYMKQLRIEAVGFSPEYPDSRGFSRFSERANIDFIASEIITGNLDPRPLISGSFHFQNIENAYHALKSRRNSPVTFLLNWTEK